MKFFNGWETVGEVKAMYRELAKQFHPDVGGNEETMKQLNIEYHKVLESMNGQTRMGTDGKDHTYRYNSATEQAIMDKVNEILAVAYEQGLDWEVEIIGIWVWVSGTVREDKGLLGYNKGEGLGMKWQRNRLMWYWKPYKGRGRRSNKSTDELRDMYGSRKVGQQTRQQRAALA